MQDNTTNQPTNPSGFFNNAVENLQANKQSSDLVVSPNITTNTRNSINLMKESPATTPINASKPGVPNIFNVQRSVLDLTKESNVNVAPTNYDLKTNITANNLIKTDSIEKSSFNINDINNKHKEIMSIEEKTKNIQTKQKASVTQHPQVINNYSSGDNPTRGPNNTGDSLMGLRMNLRSLPAWRTEMG